ncbi:DUF2848 domain-containing protein [Ottowia testudinis]|uniref:DUF2848 domain-containing protein n=1 Tax=Ottowia testudinis TaxID=2816950 RepID=A0A975CGW3_9BURK|nr:DUF2848 domain-containing protein [Ottowia testudinis]QTD45339.1 DUF2848 domain-containing protein [Ottowia testudinis]
MLLSFQLHSAQTTQALQVDLAQLVIAGWAGRDAAAIEHHIEELAAIGVPRPSAVPLYYRVAANQLTQADTVQVVGPHSSGEVEAFVFAHGGALYVSLASDHTDRKLEAHSVALSKQVCAKPVARDAWRFDDVAAHWDQLQVRAWIEEGGAEAPYQDGTLASLRSAPDLIRGYTGGAPLPEATGMSCGTVAVIGAIRPAPVFRMELHDPVLNRRIGHRYTIDVLPEVA